MNEFIQQTLENLNQDKKDISSIFIVVVVNGKLTTIRHVEGYDGASIAWGVAMQQQELLQDHINDTNKQRER
jgi:hypothetical protein